MRWTSSFYCLQVLLGMMFVMPLLDTAAEAKAHVAEAHEGPAIASVVAGDDMAPARITFGNAVDLEGSPVHLVTLSPANSLPGSLWPYLGGKSAFYPVAARFVTSGFGMRMHPLLGIQRQHGGVDLAAPMGSPVLATVDGIVAQAGSYGDYGLLVGIKAGAGVETRFAHLSRLNVASGQSVRRGQVLGWSGSTGRSTGAHLHYEVRINGRAVNPLGQFGR